MSESMAMSNTGAVSQVKSVSEVETVSEIISKAVVTAGSEISPVHTASANISRDSSADGDRQSHKAPATKDFEPTDYLCLAATVSFLPGQIVFSQQGLEFAYQCDEPLAQTLQQLFLLLDGSRPLAVIQAKFSETTWGAIAQILHQLDSQDLLDHLTPPQTARETVPPNEPSSTPTQSDLNQLPQGILDEQLRTNALWQSLKTEPTEISEHVLYGLALELQTYLSQKSAFQAPLVDFQASASVRQAFSQLYQAEQAQQTALTQALATIGFDAATTEAQLPLPETVALIQGLGFWAQTEPQLALRLQATLSRNVGQLMEAYGYVCGLAHVAEDFVEAIAGWEKDREAWQAAIATFDKTCRAELPTLTGTMEQRFIGQAHLFAELYSNWLTAIVEYYSEAPSLHRHLAEIAGDAISPERPRLANGVLLKLTSAGLEVRGQGQGIAIAVAPEKQPDMQQFLRYLQAGGRSQAELARVVPTMAEQVAPLLDAFGDRGWLATETAQHPLSGQQFYRELNRFLTRFKQQFPPSPMVQCMIDGTITQEQLVGYSLESYHVTHLCPRLLAPALGQFESPATQKLLHEFFTSELHHDTLVENSLKSVGIRTEEIQTMQPLPMTLSVCASLGVFARRHPLSFKSALMLFEEDDKTFHQLFKQRCKDLSLPPGFYRPILLHAHINEDGEHDQITKVLLEDVPYVSVEEQQLVKKNLAVLLTSMVLRTHEILEYYGNPENTIPRCFGANTGSYA